MMCGGQPVSLVLVAVIPRPWTPTGWPSLLSMRLSGGTGMIGLLGLRSDGWGNSRRPDTVRHG
jgi:hypothetical protein